MDTSSRHFKQTQTGGINLTSVISYLLLLRWGEPGLDEESLLVVSIREDLLWSCLPADDSGLFTAPKTLADLGLKEEGEVVRVKTKKHHKRANTTILKLKLTFPGVKNAFISAGR